MSRLTVNGARLTYQVAGPENAPLIVVLHGGRGIGDHRSEFEAYRPLTDRFRLVGFDQRGCGRSSLTPPFTFAQLADDVDGVRQAFAGDAPMILIGGSFGGMIALTYALAYPNGLSHLILRGTAPSHDQEIEAIGNFKARLHKAPNASIDMIDKLFSDRAIDDIELQLIWFALQPLYYERFDPDAALAATRRLSCHAETHNALYRNKDQYDVRERLGEVGVPTLAIVGSEDWICPPSQSIAIVDGIPGAELFIVDGCNHAVHLEANDQVLARIRAFLG